MSKRFGDFMGIQFLGQVGFLFEFDDSKFLLDPYLSNSVEEKEDRSIKRLVPVPFNPDLLTDIDFVLITHAHRDHCDPDTLVPLAIASPQCQFYGPAPVISVLQKSGIGGDRLHLVLEASFNIMGVSVQPVPSAHPVISTDHRGGWQAIGYVFEMNGRRYYHPGDTAVDSTVINAVKRCGKIDVAMIPVNEINYYRNRENIIGNMSVREAFQFAADINAEIVIPTHWDMFAANQVYREEIELLYDKICPKFTLEILDSGSTYVG
jgi:L-ascorbate metabolism protein UlaG (beta-lactamase superfamily)